MRKTDAEFQPDDITFIPASKREEKTASAMPYLSLKCGS
jgi:hypothetical protein